MSYTPEQLAYILAHSYVRDTRPPLEVVNEALDLKEHAIRGTKQDRGGKVHTITVRISDSAAKSRSRIARSVLIGQVDEALEKIQEDE